MAAKKRQSAVASLINGAGYVLAVLMAVHIVLVLLRIPVESPFTHAVERLAMPLALFFPGLIHVPNEVLQVLVAYGLAAVFWILLARVVARILG